MTHAELNRKLTRLGELFKSSRIELGYSIREVSKQTGLHRNTITNIENGNDCIYSSLIIYQHFLNVKIIELVEARCFTLLDEVKKRIQEEE